MAWWKRLGIAAASAAWVLPCAALLALAAADKLVVERVLVLQVATVTLALIALSIGGWAWHLSARRAQAQAEVAAIAPVQEPSLLGVLGEDGTFRAAPPVTGGPGTEDLAHAIRAQMHAIDRIEQSLSGPSGLRHGQKEALHTLAQQLREEMRAQAEHDARRYGQQQEQRDVSIRSAVELMGRQLGKVLEQLQAAHREGTSEQQAAVQALETAWRSSLMEHRQTLEGLLAQSQAQQQGGLVSLQDAFATRVDEAVAQLEGRLAEQALAWPAQLQDGVQTALAPVLQQVQALVPEAAAATGGADAAMLERLDGGVQQLQSQLGAIDAQLAQLHQMAQGVPQALQGVSQHLAAHQEGWQALELQLGTRLSSHLAAAQAASADQAQSLQASVDELGRHLHLRLTEQGDQQQLQWQRWGSELGEALARRWSESADHGARTQGDLQAEAWKAQEALLRQELAQWAHAQAEQGRLQQIQAEAVVGQVQDLSATLSRQLAQQMDTRLDEAQAQLLAASRSGVEQGVQQGLATALQRLEETVSRDDSWQRGQAAQLADLQLQGQGLMQALQARLDAAVQAQQQAVMDLAGRVGEQLDALHQAHAAHVQAVLQGQRQGEVATQQHAAQQLAALENGLAQWSGTIVAQLERSEHAQRQSLQSHREVVATLVQEIATDLHAARSQWAQLDADETPSELVRLQEQLQALAGRIDQSLQSSELQRMGEQARALESFQHFSTQVAHALDQLRALGERHDGAQQAQLQRLQTLQDALEAQSRQQIQAVQDAAVQREALRGAQVDALGTLAERMEQQLEAAWQRAAQAQEQALAEQQSSLLQLQQQTARLADEQAALRSHQQDQAQAIVQATETVARQQAEQLAMAQAVERRLAVLTRLEEKVETAQALLAELGADRLGERLAEVQGILSSRVPRLLDDRLSQVNDLLSRHGQTMEAWFSRHGEAMDSRLRLLGQGMETGFDGMRERMTAHAGLGENAEARADDPRVRKIYLNLADLQETLRRERRILAERLRATGTAH